VSRSLRIVIALGLVAAAGCTQTAAVDRAAPAPTAAVSTPVGTTPSPRAEVPDEAAMGHEGGSPRRFRGGVSVIGPKLRETLIGRNWTPGCPVPIRDLRLVTVSYWNFRGEVEQGPLVLHERVAEDVLWVFRQLFRARFPIKSIELAAKDRPRTSKDYWNRSPRSVTASFNCRPATGSSSLSHHSYGWAIDINPLQNPYVRSDGSTLRHIAKPFRNRSWHRIGMIHEGDVVVRSFARIGWEWGGHWHTLKDYMHFSLTGR
jgi:D-alanyl-D-alanine carboxypeptidase